MARKNEDRRAGGKGHEGDRRRRVGGDDRAARRMAEAWEKFGREIDRSRRYGHALTLMRIIPPADGAPATRVPRRHGLRLRRAWQARTLGLLVADLQAMVRCEDVVWEDGSGILILLPESDPAAGGALAARLQTRGPASMRLAEIDLASFPDDGFTGESLVAAITGPIGSAPPATLSQRRVGAAAAAAPAAAERLSTPAE
jgi:hypothetical protein